MNFFNKKNTWILNGHIGALNPSPSRFQNMQVVSWVDWVIGDVFRTQTC
jgi:hypothetical protein